MEFFKDINLSNKRDDKETYDQYKERRLKNYERIKAYLKGDLVWESKIKGTYIINKHGKLK